MQTRWKRIGIFLLGLLAFFAVAAYGLLDRYKVELYESAMALQEQSLRLKPLTVQVEGFEWSYLENDLRGQKPTLLMVHGFGAFKENWLDLATQLKDEFHLVLVDLPGHGASSFDPALRYDLDDQVQRLHAFTQAIGLQAFHIIGNSMGGGIAALYGGLYPEQISSVILLNPAGIRDVKSQYDQYLDKGENPLIVENEADFEFLVDFAMEQRPFIPWPFTTVSTQRMQQRKAKNDQIFSDLVGTHQFEFKDVITNITSPTLVVWGKQDRVLAAGNAVEFQRLIPHAQVALLEGVGHAPMLEIPVQCADLVRNFITVAVN